MKFHFRSYDHHHHHGAGGGGGVVVHRPASDHPSSLLVIDAHAVRGGSIAAGGALGGPAVDEPNDAYQEREERQDFGLDASLHKGHCVHSPVPMVPPSAKVPMVRRSKSEDHIASSWLASAAPPGSAPSANANGIPIGPSNGSGASDALASLSQGTAQTHQGSPPTKRALHLDHHAAECPITNPDPASRPRSRQFFRLGKNKKKPSNSSSGCSGHTSSSDEDDDGRLKDVIKTEGKSKGGIKWRKMRRAHSLPVTVKKSTSCPEGLVSAVEIQSQLSFSEHLRRPRANSVDRLSSSQCVTRTDRRNKHQRHVSFASVSIREYSTILGDHPCCPSGPPLSLGWTVERENNGVEFEKYERERGPVRARRQDLRLCGEERHRILESLVVTSAAVSTVTTGNACGNLGNGEEGTDKDGSKVEQQCCTTAVYSQRELRRAERRLARDQAGLNSRQHNRMNRKFFCALTPAECQIGGACAGLGVVAATEEGGDAMEGASLPTGEPGGGNEESSRMDISPVKSPATAALAAMEDDDTPI